MKEVFESLGINEKDFKVAREMAATNLTGELGPKYKKYISRVGAALLEVMPEASSFTPEELVDLISITDVIGADSRGVMKRMKSACSGCGWCCSQTKKIIVKDEDTLRISRKLKQKREDLFIYDGSDWLIKNSNPCGWWNPRNGRCLIYNDRPHTCRVWPLGINDEGQNTLQPAWQCNYAVMVLVNKVAAIIQSSSLKIATETI